MSTSPGPSGARQRSKHASSTTPGSGLGSGSDSESASNQETLKTTTRPSTASSKRKKDNGSAGLTVLKALAGLVVFVPALSYLIMDGESFTFGYNPRWLKWEYWNPPKPITLTDAQLALHNGSDPTLPILLAINGSVFDVSVNPATYGPGGGYNVFAGVDAARGFITGCFAEDRTWDLRGVEDMFLELDEELDLFEEGKWVELVRKFGSADGEDGKGELSEERKKELRGRVDERRRKAWENVENSINHWDSFFRNHERYKYVGKVIHRDISGDPVRAVCASALKKRPSKEE